MKSKKSLNTKSLNTKNLSIKSMSIALACLLALPMAACGSDGTQQGSGTAQGTESGSADGEAENRGQSEEKRDEPAQKEPKKDEPALDWSAVPTAPEEDFVFNSASIGPSGNAVKGVEIKKYQGEGGAVKIPDSYRGQPVILISKNAFKESNVTDVYFETEGFVYIQPRAFIDCTSLNSVVIKGNEKTEIRDWAFEGCSSLSSVVLSEEITNFGIQPFEDTPWLAGKKQEDPLVIVNNTVLDGELCTGDVVIPDGVVRIAPRAFSENENITSVTLPDSIWRIEPQAFTRCTSLTSINIPDNTESIGGAEAYIGSEKVVLTYKGKKYTYEKLKELEALFW